MDHITALILKHMPTIITLLYDVPSQPLWFGEVVNSSRIGASALPVPTQLGGKITYRMVFAPSYCHCKDNALIIKNLS
jgi:hypothetical protein